MGRIAYGRPDVRQRGARAPECSGSTMLEVPTADLDRSARALAHRHSCQSRSQQRGRTFGSLSGFALWGVDHGGRSWPARSPAIRRVVLPLKVCCALPVWCRSGAAGAHRQGLRLGASERERGSGWIRWRGGRWRSQAAVLAREPQTLTRQHIRAGKTRGLPRSLRPWSACLGSGPLAPSSTCREPWSLPLGQPQRGRAPERAARLGPQDAREDGLGGVELPRQPRLRGHSGHGTQGARCACLPRDRFIRWRYTAEDSSRSRARADS